MQLKRSWLMSMLAVLIFMIVIGGVALVRSFSAKVDESKAPIKIGALYPLTGGLSSYGDVASKSTQIAVEEINARGGINGSKLVIDMQDHQCSPQTAVSAYKQLSELGGVKVFTSVACSGTALSIAPLLESSNSLMMGTITTSPKLTGISGSFFRNWASDANEASLFADEIKKRGYKKIGIVFEETDYAKGLKLSLEKLLEGSGVEILSESFTTGSADVKTQLLKLREANIEMLFVSPQTVVSGDVVLRQMQEIGFRPNIFVNDNIIKSNSLIESYSDLLQGAIGGDYLIPNNARANDFLKKYKQKFGEDCGQVNICLGVYDSINVLADGIRGNGYDAGKVKEYLRSVKYDGVSGEISFGEKNDRNNAGYALFIVSGKKAIPYK